MLHIIRTEKNLQQLKRSGFNKVELIRILSLGWMYIYTENKQYIHSALVVTVYLNKRLTRG